MKQCIWGMIVLVLFWEEIIAFQGETWGARHRGLADIAATLQSDPSCLAENCAGLYPFREPTFAVSIVPSVFGLGELKTRILLVALPLSFGTIGAGVRDFGFDLYHESSVMFGFGFPLAGSVSAGIGSEARRIVIKGYGSQTVILGNAGIQIPAGNSFLLAGTASNVFGETVGLERERIPRSVSLGAAFVPGEGILVAIELEKDTRNPEIVKFGAEFNPIPPLILRGGLKNNPMEWTFGVSCEVNFLGFVYGGSFHGVLGWIHQFDFTVRVKQ